MEEERGGRLAKLDELAANLKRLERVALDNSTYLDENLRIHALWSALRAVNNTIDAPMRRPFRDELRVLRHAAAARDDAVVGVALDALEAGDAPDVGVEPLADLASWFTTSVAPAVSRVALVPDDGAGVLAHVTSYFLSAFAFRRQGLVPGDDVLSVLARAEYHLNEKDLDSATRELNQLQGTARTLLKDWLEAARRRLEVQQALEVRRSFLSYVTQEILIAGSPLIACANPGYSRVVTSRTGLLDVLIRIEIDYVLLLAKADFRNSRSLREDE